MVSPAPGSACSLGAQSPAWTRGVCPRGAGLSVLSCGGRRRRQVRLLPVANWPSGAGVTSSRGLLGSQSEALHRPMRVPVCLPSPSQRLNHVGLGGPRALLGWLAWGSRSPAGCVGRGTPQFSRGPCAGSPLGPAGPKPTLGATQLFARSQASHGTPRRWVLPDAPAWDTPLLRTEQAWGRLWVQAPVPAPHPAERRTRPRSGRAPPTPSCPRLQ